MTREDELPFGTIKEANIPEQAEQPLRYAEVQGDGGVLMWQSEDYPGQVEEKFYMYYRVSFNGSNNTVEFTEKEELSREKAEKILEKFADGEWTLAE